MDTEQKDRFLRAAQLGVACGLDHRYEWYVNALRALKHGDYSCIDDEREALTEAFIAFEKECAGSPRESQMLSKLDWPSYQRLVNDWYNRRANTSVQGSLPLKGGKDET